MKFYFHYERDVCKAKLVISDGTKETDILVDKIVCKVPTQTKRNEDTPKFVVEGECIRLQIFEDEVESLAVLDNFETKIKTI